MNIDKLNFVSSGFLPFLNNLDAGAKGKWGKMNGQQMVEHLSAFFAISTGKLTFPMVTPIALLPKFKEFLWSEKEFRENTKAPVLPEEPLPLKFATMGDSIKALNNEVKEFVDQFGKDDKLIREHPVFGALNFEEWVLLHYKHVNHHLRQFGLV